MPYPNEHACRLKDPKQFERFARRKRKAANGKEYVVILGIKNGKSEEQAYRYNKKVWSASEARSHCKKHGGRFEPAKKEADMAEEKLYHAMFLGDSAEVVNEDGAVRKGILRHPISSLALNANGYIVWFTEVEWDGKVYAARSRMDGYIPVLNEHGGVGLFASERTPIGYNLRLEIEGDGKSSDTLWMAETKFDLKSEVGRELYRLHKEGIKRGWSIGFTATHHLAGDEADEFLAAQGREERGIPVMLAPMIWEYSSVTFPANPDSYNGLVVKQLQDMRQMLIETDSVALDRISQLEQRIQELAKRVESTASEKTQTLGALPLVEGLRRKE